MPYGDVTATISAYGDTTLCLRCAIVAYTLARQEKIAANAFTWWLRDLNIEQAEITLFGEEGASGEDEHQFCMEVAHKNWPDPEDKNGEPLSLLHEGQTVEQDILNERDCTKCLVPLQSLCQDYP